MEIRLARQDGHGVKRTTDVYQKVPCAMVKMIAGTTRELKPFTFSPTSFNITSSQQGHIQNYILNFFRLVIGN